MKLNVNTTESIKLTSKLERLNESAFPNAVRNTLNQVAFNAKKQVPEQAQDKFTIRQKNLFKRFVVVEKATGFNVNNMKSKFGLDGRTNKKLIQGLEKQETGGNLKGRKLTPHNLGRVSGNYTKKLKAKNQFRKIGAIATKNRRVKGSKFIRIDKGSTGTVFEVKRKGLTPIFNYRKNPNTNLKKREYLKPSAEIAIVKVENIYKQNADFQFKKALNR